MRNMFLLFLTITALTVKGQNNFLGVKGGVSWTNVAATNFTMGNHVRTGLAIGLTYDYIFKKNFSTGAELIYNQRGFINNTIIVDEFANPTGEIWTTKFNYDYLSLPLKVGFNYGKTVYGFVNMALTPALIIDEKRVIPTFNTDGKVNGTKTIDVNSKVNKFDIGGLVEIGGGYKFKDRYWLFTSFSYQHSFTTITNSDYFSNSKIRHNGMTLSIGLKYALTKG